MKNYYNKIAVGGTFDRLHNGHEFLIKTAFELSDNILIGITSDAFASLKCDNIEPCKVRINRLRDIIKEFDKEYIIKAIDDPYGTAIDDVDLEAIVVSHETEDSAIKINEIRKKKGLKLLDIVVIEWILAEDNIPISSTRIRKGEIDQKGYLL